MKRLTIMLAVLAFTHAVPGDAQGGTRRVLRAADTAQAVQFDLRAILPVCERALQAAIDGHSAAPVLEEGFKALPDDQKQAALGVCQVYALGAVSMLKHMQAAPKVPAGGTSI